jgi:hypothetical protein
MANQDQPIASLKRTPKDRSLEEDILYDQDNSSLETWAPPVQVVFRFIEFGLSAGFI